MNSGGVIDVTLDVQQEARVLLMQEFKKDPKLVLLEIKGTDLECITQHLSGLQGPERSEAVYNLRNVLRDILEDTYRFPIDGRDYPWEQHFFFEMLSSDTTIFKIYAVLKKPGLMDALIKAASEKIWETMRRMDVDTVHTVYFEPMTMCSLYVPAAAEIYERHIRGEVNNALASLHVVTERTTNDGLTAFTCRRTG